MFNVSCVIVNAISDQPVINNVPHGINNDFLLIPKSSYKLKIDGTWHEFKRHTAFFFPKYTPLYYASSDNEPFIECSIHFRHDNEIPTHFSLPVGQPIYLTDPYHVYDLIDLIAYENIVYESNREEILDNLMRAMFLKISDSSKLSSLKPHFNAMYNIRNKIYLHPEYDWSLENIADILHMSHNNIHRLYKEYFDTTISQDVITSRIKQAREYLSHTTHPINMIAVYCGYRNTEHFCRQFKKIEGVTPKQFRKNSYNTGQ